ncbi:hypothetical protein [Natrinema thermotolerans]|uniref:hypothetical protein n=1 Tax=Natrinema thermotolerans TaxID=121872 RepID=UPI00067924C2|nr:hypothetical protein [Natrinema thermotolerans]QCC57263.1 hypothetical protein DVR14_00895 [Natrinema thermotolerans]
MTNTTTPSDTIDAARTDEYADQLEMIDDAATLAYAVFRRVDFDGMSDRRNFDDEFVTAIEAATFCESVMTFLQGLADTCEVRAVDAMDGDTRTTVRKYDGADSRVPTRRFLRTVRRHPAFVVDEMKHAHVDTNGGDDA